jgi:hypothetical protein
MGKIGQSSQAPNPVRRLCGDTNFGKAKNGALSRPSAWDDATRRETGFRAGGGAVHSIKSGCEQWQQTNALFDHLVGGREQRLWNFEAEHLGGFEVDS